MKQDLTDEYFSKSIAETSFLEEMRQQKRSIMDAESKLKALSNLERKGLRTTNMKL